MWALCSRRVKGSGRPSEGIGRCADGGSTVCPIDAGALIQCASNNGLFRTALPATADLPIKTLDWKNEGFGTSGGVRASVHGMGGAEMGGAAPP